MNIQDIIDHTDARIVDWYELAKTDFDIIGAGKAHYNKDQNKVVVEYTENGVQTTWEMAWYPEYISNDISWVYNCWSELA